MTTALTVVVCWLGLPFALLGLSELCGRATGLYRRLSGNAKRPASSDWSRASRYTTGGTPSVAASIRFSTRPGSQLAGSEILRQRLDGNRTTGRGVYGAVTEDPGASGAHGRLVA